MTKAIPRCGGSAFAYVGSNPRIVQIPIPSFGANRATWSDFVVERAVSAFQQLLQKSFPGPRKVFHALCEFVSLLPGTSV